MPSITLPSTPGAASAAMRFVSKHNTLKSLFGGTNQVIQRMGSKWAIDIRMPPMTYDVARVWIARLTHGAVEPVLVPVPQYMAVGEPGAPRVDGSGQAGTFLNLKGFAPGYEMQEGQFFTVVTPGGADGPDRCLYQVLEPVTADAAGKMRLHFNPMLRRQAPDNAVVEVAVPVIEGFVQTAQEWSIDTARTVGLQFSVEERV